MITKPEHVAGVRKSILDLAVRARLVVREPSDVASWRETTLGAACERITDGTHRTPTYVATGIPFLSVKDFSGGRLRFTATRFISASEHAELSKRCAPQRGDVLIGRIGTLGKAVIVDTDRAFSLFVSVGLLRPRSTVVLPEYLRLYLNSPVAHREYDRIKIGGATHTNKLNLGDLKA
jgi:type I restriction enzyme S subunit